MTFLPIVTRELRVASRRRGIYWARTGAAMAVITLGTFFFIVLYREPSKVVAMTLFGIMTGGAALYALLAGVFSTADCLSEEKREGTLGLLFLTDLKGYDVVLGKLAASSLNALYGVLAVVPILAIPLLMGGVTSGEFARMALVAVNTLFFSLGIGLGVSAMSRSARSAVGMTFFFIMLFAVGLPLCSAIMSIRVRTVELVQVLLVPSPGFGFACAFDDLYKQTRPAFWVSMAVIHGIGWLFLVLACLIAPRTWKDQPTGTATRRWRERVQSWLYGQPAERAAFRWQLLNRNAFFWLAARVRLKPVQVWVVLGLIACGWAWGLIEYGRDWLNAGIYTATGLVLNMLLKGWFASESGRQLAEERQSGSLELLLSTPLTVRDILRGQMLALKRQFLGPGIVVLGLSFAFMLASFSEMSGPDERAFCLCGWGAAMVMLAADLAALYWVGLWQALTARSPHRAVRATGVRVLLLPWLGMALVFLMAVLYSLAAQHEVFSWQLFLGAWVVLGLMADIGFGLSARQKLLFEFRLAAEQRFTPRTGFWKRLTGGGESRPVGTAAASLAATAGK